MDIIILIARKNQFKNISWNKSLNVKVSVTSNVLNVKNLGIMQIFVLKVKAVVSNRINNLKNQ